MSASRVISITAAVALILAFVQYSEAEESVSRAEVQTLLTDKMLGLLWATRQKRLESLGLSTGELEIFVEKLASKVAHCILESYLAQSNLQQIDEMRVFELLIGKDSKSRVEIEKSLDFDAVRERIRICNEPIEREYGFALD